MAIGDQPLEHVAADESSCACEQNAHCGNYFTAETDQRGENME
jgi:hypothetical protein